MAMMGGMASGGDVTSGRAYIVGEKRPEVFVPREHGRIVPSIPEFAKSLASSSTSSSISKSYFDSSDTRQSFSSHEIASSAFANSTLKKSASAALLSALPRREYGGNVMAGHAYLTGESRPEVFVPDRASASGSGGSEGRGGHGPTTHNTTIHINGVKDMDSFRKSKGQIMAEMRGNLDRAFYRNR
jgi:SLT domain-containing protein